MTSAGLRGGSGAARAGQLMMKTPETTSAAPTTIDGSSFSPSSSTANAMAASGTRFTNTDVRAGPIACTPS